MNQWLKRSVCAAAALIGTVAATNASAQVIGPLRWQFAPYCNVVTLTAESRGSIFRLDGFDDMCGGAKRASASGTAQVNPDGTAAVSLTLVRPDGLSVALTATVNVGTLAGTWSDDYGNTGTFTFNAASPAPGSPRPVTLRGTYGARGIQVTGATPALASISFGRSLPFTPQARAVAMGSGTTTECPGTPEAPRAAPGFLCVYERSSSNSQSPPAVSDSSFTPNVADRFGAVVLITSFAPGTFGNSGTWAVTVP